MHPRRFTPLLLLLALLCTSTASAQQDPPVGVHFPQGMQSTTVSGTLTGERTADYILDVGTAQVIQLKLSGSNNAYLHLYAPGQDTALNGGGDGRRFSGLLTTPGTYRIQIYQRGAMADSNQEPIRFTLSVALR